MSVPSRHPPKGSASQQHLSPCWLIIAISTWDCPLSRPHHNQSSQWLFQAGTSNVSPPLVPDPVSGSHWGWICLSPCNPEGPLAVSVVIFGCRDLARGGVGGKSYWHLVSWGQGCLLYTLQCTREPLQQRFIWHKMSVLPRLRNAALVFQVLSWNLLKTVRIILYALFISLFIYFFSLGLVCFLIPLKFAFFTSGYCHGEREEIQYLLPVYELWYSYC